MQYMNFMVDEATRELCTKAVAQSSNIPLRVKLALAAGFLADAEFKHVPTEELIGLAKDRKHILTDDRASAIAVLKGTRP